MTEQMDEQMSFFDLASPSLKTYQESFPQTLATTSEQFSMRSAPSATIPLMYLDLRTGFGNLLGAYWETVIQLPGKSMMLNTGESPNVEKESTLSQILQANVPEKYYLSPKACNGILRRAENRNKMLPDMLRDALMEVVGSDGCHST